MKLRKLELEAYSSLINAFRAQGNFSKEKKRILLELRSYLSISIERHQAEIRRAVNDDKLSKVSSNLNGEDKLDGWVIEGRRVIPLLKRMAPKTGVSSVADRVARYQVKQNQQEQLASTMTDHSLESETNHHMSKVVNQCSNQSNLKNDQTTKKRQTTCELTNSKRKYVGSSIDKQKLKTQVNASHQLATKTITTTAVTVARQEHPITSIHSVNNLILNEHNKQQQPKLLIMSTSAGSVIANHKPIDHSIHYTHHNQSSSLSVHQHHSSESFDQLVEKSSSLEENKTSNDLTTSINQLITTSSTAKIYNPKVQNASSSSQSPKLMILPNSGSQQTKTLTIPLLHNVKTLQLPTQNSTILYSAQPMVNSSSNLTNCSTSTLKTSVPGITIQTIKTPGSNKSNNFIIMPNKTSTTNNNTGSTQAKGLLRQMSVTNAKEFPLKFISTTAQSMNTTKDQQSSNDKIGCDLSEQQQPTIILTNVRKEMTGSPVRNLIKNHSVHPNIIKGIKVIPKCSSTNMTQLQTATSIKIIGTNNKGSPNQKAITIPANFMEILKNIPINRISSPQSPSSDGSKTTTISITQNLNAQQLGKANLVKIPANATSESITKLIFSSVSNSGSMNSSGSTTVAVQQMPANAAPLSTKVVSSSDASESKKITLITKNSTSPDIDKQSTMEQQSVLDNVKMKTTNQDIKSTVMKDEPQLSNAISDNEISNEARMVIDKSS